MLIPSLFAFLCVFRHCNMTLVQYHVRSVCLVGPFITILWQVCHTSVLRGCCYIYLYMLWQALLWKLLVNSKRHDKVLCVSYSYVCTGTAALLLPEFECVWAIFGWDIQACWRGPSRNIGLSFPALPNSLFLVYLWRQSTRLSVKTLKWPLVIHIISSSPPKGANEENELSPMYATLVCELRDRFIFETTTSLISFHCCYRYVQNPRLQPFLAHIMCFGWCNIPNWPAWHIVRYTFPFGLRCGECILQPVVYTLSLHL